MGIHLLEPWNMGTSNIYNSQENGRQATNKALAIAIPEVYRRAHGDMGPAIYTSTDDPRAILLGLQRRYGKRTPTKKEEAVGPTMEPRRAN